MNTSRREDYLFPSIGAIALWRDTLCQMHLTPSQRAQNLCCRPRTDAARGWYPACIQARCDCDRH